MECSSLTEDSFFTFFLYSGVDDYFVKFATNVFKWNVQRLQMFFFVFFSFNFFTTEPEIRQCRFLNLCRSKSHRLKIFHLRTLKLEDTNNYILWSILGHGKNTSYNHLLNMACTTTLEVRRKFQSLVLVCKCIHKNAPRYIKAFFKIKVCNYNLRGLRSLLTLPNLNLEWRYNSLFQFLTAKLWNLLPTYVRNAKEASS